MKRILAFLKAYSAAYATGAIVLAIVITDLARAAGWGWPAISSMIADFLPGRPRVIKRYVEFAEAEFGALTISTGIKFVSSIDGKIDSQWCYAEFAAKKRGEPEYTLHLAFAKGVASPVPYVFSTAQLRPFGLSVETAAGLVKSHCQFKRS